MQLTAGVPVDFRPHELKLQTMQLHMSLIIYFMETKDSNSQGIDELKTNRNNNNTIRRKP